MGSMDWEMAGGMQPPRYRAKELPSRHGMFRNSAAENDMVNGMGNDTADNTENDPVNDPAGKEGAFREREPMHLQEVSSAVTVQPGRRSSGLSHIWLWLFLGGLLAGTAFVNWLAWGNTMYSGTQMGDFVQNLYDFPSGVGMLIKILIKRFGIFLFLAGITLLCRRSLVLYLSAAYFGFCFGTVISVMTIQYGPEGLWILLKALLPHYLLYVPAYMMVIKWAQDRFSGKTGARRRWDKEGIGILALSGVMFIAGSVLECYVSPIWAAFLENFWDTGSY